MLSVKRSFKIVVRGGVVDHRAFWFHKTWRGERTLIQKIFHYAINSTSIELPAVKSRNNIATFRLVFLIPDVYIEQREALLPLHQTVATLNTASPPFAVMAARTELLQLITVFCRPTMKPEVIGFGAQPPIPASHKHITIVGDVDEAVGPVDLLGDNALLLEPGDLGEGDKFGAGGHLLFVTSMMKK